MAEKRTLEKYLRGRIWWIKGRRPDTREYIRESLGTSIEIDAEAKVDAVFKAARDRSVLGSDAPKPQDEITFGGAVLLYDAGQKEAAYLTPLVRKIGNTKLKDLMPQAVRKMAKEIYPYASTDTWQRQVITPVRAVINNAHELGKCAPIRIRAFSKEDRIRQDRFRGTISRAPKTPGSWPWVLAFCDRAEPRDAALALFMFTTGARVGQSLAMTRKNDMDLSEGRLQLPAAKGHDPEWVDISPELVVMIANLPAPYRGKAKKLVFYISGGRSGALYRRWKATCVKAGIEYIPPHAAGRHGFGTEMVVRQRVDPVSAAKEGRWSSPAIMLETYAHPEGSRETVRAAFRAGFEAARTNSVQPTIDKPRKAAGDKA